MKSVAYNSGYGSLAVGIGDSTTVIGIRGFSTLIAEGNNASISSSSGEDVVKLIGDSGNVFVKDGGCIITIEGKDCAVRFLKRGIVKGTRGTKIIFSESNNANDVYTIRNEDMAHYVYLESSSTKYVLEEVVYDVNALHKSYMSRQAYAHIYAAI